MREKYEPTLLTEVAREVREIIARADVDGVALDDGNVVDLLADNITDLPLDTLRDALVISGYGGRFPRATRRHEGN